MSASSSRRTDFARVYEENVWSVYGMLAYQVHDRQLAEDLTQATFERALRAWSRFDPRGGSERAWLLRIAHNLLIDHARRSPPIPVELDERVAPQAPDPQARFAGSPELLEMIARLPQRDQEVLALRFGGELSTAEIAGLLELSVANVQQILSRSLRRLRAWLQNDPVA